MTLSLKISDAGLKFVEGWEGLFLQAYDDETERVVKPGERVYGTLTIGYGHTSAAGPPHVYAGMKIDNAMAIRILEADLLSVEAEVDHLVRVSLNQNQYDAVVDFQFNTDWLAHEHCSLLIALNAGNFNLADEDFMLYDRAQGKVLVGLDRRRAAEKKLFATPWVSPPLPSGLLTAKPQTLSGAVAAK
jgi:lysozyme